MEWTDSGWGILTSALILANTPPYDPFLHRAYPISRAPPPLPRVVHEHLHSHVSQSPSRNKPTPSLSGFGFLRNYGRHPSKRTQRVADANPQSVLSAL